jgi:hypothetical protein
MALFATKILAETKPSYQFNFYQHPPTTTTSIHAPLLIPSHVWFN